MDNATNKAINTIKMKGEYQISTCGQILATNGLKANTKYPKNSLSVVICNNLT